MKILNVGLCFIYVRPAAERRCSVDLFMKAAEKRGNELAHERRPGLACLLVEAA